MTDVVYVLGSGSFWSDNELRFSLRSLELNLEDLGNVYVVGTRPRWLTGVTHLPYQDKYPCKERNIMEKLAYACGHCDLTETFLHMHDDHFMLTPGPAIDVPYWCGGSLEKMAAAVNPRNHWRDAVINTHKALAARGLETRNFDLHYPILINKNLYPQVMDEYDWRGTPRGFVVKSLYANTLKLPAVVTSDLKIVQRYHMHELVERLRGRPWFSVGNAGLNNTFKSLFSALYPSPSRFEIV